MVFADTYLFHSKHIASDTFCRRFTTSIIKHFLNINSNNIKQLQLNRTVNIVRTTTVLKTMKTVDISINTYVKTLMEKLTK
jgi:hypothetical protein